MATRCLYDMKGQLLLGQSSAEVLREKFLQMKILRMRL